MIRFHCPNCKRKLKAEYEEAGSQQPCPKCQELLIVPGALRRAIVDQVSKIAMPFAMLAVKSAIKEHENRRFIFYCNFCGRKLSSTVSSGGEMLPCPSCKNVVAVPTPEKSQTAVVPASLPQKSLPLSCDPMSLVEKYVVHDNYIKEHNYIINDVRFPPKAIVELMLFHGWVTQFGFRIFTSYPEKSNALVYEVLNLIHIMCPYKLAVDHGVRFEGLPVGLLEKINHKMIAYSVPNGFEDVLIERWNEFDSIYLRCKWADEKYAQSAICDAVTKNCGVENSMPASAFLSLWYLNRLVEIQEDAVSAGLLV